jgi:hypothetical protein
MVVSLVVFTLLAARPAYPQAASGTITGTVTDQSGATVPGATVVLTRVDQGVNYSATTTRSGLYEARFLPPGEYAVSVGVKGFKKEVKTGLVLVVGQVMRVDFQLQVGAARQTVEVRGDVTQLLKAESSEVGQIITSRQVVDLPLNGRNFADLIPLNAGVTKGMQDAANNGFNLNGGRTDQNMFMLEGIDNIDINSNLIISPSIDAIQEFQIQTSNFSAEFGRAAGGVVQVELRSGTNHFHGTVFEFLRNDKLDANNFFSNQLPPEAGETSAPKSPLKRNQFGVAIGGPIIKDKFFVFGDYQGSREVDGVTDTYSVPTPLERLGDFSQTLPAGQPVFQNALLGQLYPGCDAQNFTPATCQVIPNSGLDPVAVKVAQFYPLPNIPGVFVPGYGTFDNYTTAGSEQSNADSFDIKVDVRPTDWDSLSIHYSYAGTNGLIPAAFGGGTLGPCIGCGIGGADLLAGAQYGRAQNVGLTYVRNFSPTWVNEFRTGVSRSYGDYATSDGGKNLAEEVGMSNVNVDKFTTGLPWFYMIPAPTWTGTSPFTPSLTALTVYQFTDNLSHVAGRHGIKTGFDIRRRLNNGAGNFFPRGDYYFAPFFTADPTTEVGSAFADFLTGRAVAIGQDLTQGTRGMRGIDYGVYFQDDFKVHPRLTLNLGIRYELYPGYYEVHDRSSMIDLQTGVVLLAGKNGAPRSFINTNKDNFAPRLGFAWTPRANGKTVIRGGYGISYFNGDFQVLGAFLNSPYTGSFSITNLDPDTLQAIATLSDGLPIQFRPTPANFDTKDPMGSWHQPTPIQKTPNSRFYTLGVERALPGDMVLDVAYVGTRGIHLPGENEGDPVPPGPTGNMSQRYIYYNLIPDVTSIDVEASRFYSTYNALQAKLEKKFSRGLQFLATYTYAKSMDNKSGSSVTGGGDSNPTSEPQDPFNIDADWARSSFDITHRFVTAFNYDLPAGKGRHFGSSWNPFLDAFLGGWQANGIVTLQTGLPFSVFATTGANCGCTANDMRADRLKNGNLPKTQRKISGWFDPTAFADPPSSGVTGPPVGRWGNSARNIIYGPGFANIDFSVFKKFRVHEKLELQFRAEFFNLFNHTNFYYPTSSQNATWVTGGLITKSYDPRIGQLALKLVF